VADKPSEQGAQCIHRKHQQRGENQSHSVSVGRSFLSIECQRILFLSPVNIKYHNYFIWTYVVV
jgi:hypothetical protein